MIECLLCPRPIYPGERFEKFLSGNAHVGCIADWEDDQAEASEDA